MTWSRSGTAGSSKYTPAATTARRARSPESASQLFAPVRRAASPGAAAARTRPCAAPRSGRRKACWPPRRSGDLGHDLGSEQLQMAEVVQVEDLEVGARGAGF